MSKAKPKYLTKADILGADDRARGEVEVPEWGGTVLLLAPTSWELSEFQGQQIKMQAGADGKTSTSIDLTGSNARLAAMCIVDEKDERLFSEKDVRKLGSKSAKALDRVVEAIRGLDGMDDALDVIEGNSE
jgi:hypothetical protein